MERARRHQRLFSALAFGLLAVAAELLSPIDAEVAARLQSALQTAAADPDPGPALRHGSAVAHRMVGYLGRMVSAPGQASRHVQR